MLPSTRGANAVTHPEPVEANMKKLTLDLDELTVESFDAMPESQSEEGTVKGFDSTYDEDTCVGPSCRRPCTWQSCNTYCDTCSTCVC
jgi:hypothetical protein